jgi:hypothetical protein
LEEAILLAQPKENRPVSDPNWQKVTGGKVIAALRAVNELNLPSGPAPLKPITIRLFLDITNYLFHKFGGVRFQIDNNNYVDKVSLNFSKLNFLY